MTIMIKTTNQLMKDTEEMLGVQCLCQQNKEIEEIWQNKYERHSKAQDLQDRISRAKPEWLVMSSLMLLLKNPLIRSFDDHSYFYFSCDPRMNEGKNSH